MGRKSRGKKLVRTAPPSPVGKRGSARSRGRRRLVVVTAALVAIGLGVGLTVALGHGGRPAPKLGPRVANQTALPGLQTGPPPWPAEHAKLAARLDALGLPRLQMEGDVLHIHQHLDLYVNGRHLAVPALVGIDERQRYLDPIHTHDASGIIHIESPSNSAYTLGQFFAVWGVRLTKNCIGGLCSAAGRTLTAWVDGRSVVGDPARIVLDAHQEIVVAYGTRAQLPRKIPSSYTFPAGL